MGVHLFKNQEADRRLDSKAIKLIINEISQFDDDLSVRYDPQDGNFKIGVNLQNCNDPDAVSYKEEWSVFVSYDGLIIDHKADFYLRLYLIDGLLAINPEEVKQKLLAKKDEYYKFLRLAEKIKNFLSNLGFKVKYEIRSKSSIYYRLDYDYNNNTRMFPRTLRVSNHRSKRENKEPDFELRYSQSFFGNNLYIDPNKLNELEKELTAIKNERAYV